MALTGGWDVGGELVKRGLVPEHCCELKITCNINNVVTLETKSYMTDEWWGKFMEVLQVACANGQVNSFHTTVNVETGEVVES